MKNETINQMLEERRTAGEDLGVLCKTVESATSKRAFFYNIPYKPIIFFWTKIPKLYWFLVTKNISSIDFDSF